MPETEKIWDDLKRGRHPGEVKLEMLQQVRTFEAAAQAADRAAPISTAKADDLERLALLDNLTDLYNYRTFLKELKAEIERSKRYGQPLSLCMVAIDNFDAIKSQFGHLTGEAVLRVAGGAIGAVVREADIAAKYDYSIFAIILPQTTCASAAFVGERIRTRLGSQALSYNWQNFSITGSLGVAAIPGRYAAYDQLIAGAQAALAHASARGGDRVFCM